MNPKIRRSTQENRLRGHLGIPPVLQPKADRKNSMMELFADRIKDRKKK